MGESVGGALFLVVASDPTEERLDVGERLLVGRDGEVTSLHPDPELSRRHALITRRPDGSLGIEDLGSANGTFVNGERLHQPATLREGDRIRVGSATLEVRRDGCGVRTDGRGSSGAPDVAGTTPRPIDQAGSPTAVRRLHLPVHTLPAVLVHETVTIPVPSGGLAIGRQSGSDIVVETERASRRHAYVGLSDGRHYVADLRSVNGTSLNGELLVGEARWLSPGDTITVGGEEIRFLIARGAQREADLFLDPGVQLVRFDGVRLTIGRDGSNDVHLDSPTISRFHAEVVAIGGALELRDLGSQNGTRLDGQRVVSGTVRVGSEISIGPFRLIYDGVAFVKRDDRGALRLDSHAVSVAVRDKVILEPTSLSIQPGELVVVIGESGSGKTTLLRVLAGVTRPSTGRVLVNGEPVDGRLTDLGYLPQDEIVHPRLNVAESLRYSARLRLPPDASPEEIHLAVSRALDDTGLQEHAETRIGSLSGGQRKRVGLATELLGSPGLLFLDEPTTGLDPSLETRMMELFRELAAVGSHALLVVTHATKNLDLADRLCIMGRGGIACFVGSPEDARAFFGVRSFDDVYNMLDRHRPEEWRQSYEAARPRPAPTPTTPEPVESAGPKRPVGRHPGAGWLQSRVLTRRYLTVFVRDRRNLLILLLQAPFIGLAISLLFAPDVFRPPGEGSPSSATQLLFVLVVSMAWLGTISSVREVIKERTVYTRERAVGVGVGAYLVSKLSVLAPLVAIQAALLALFVFVLQPLNEEWFVYVQLMVVLALTGLVAVGMGLSISSLVRTEEQAMTLIPIAMILLLLFGGALVTVRDMGTVVAGLSTVIFSRWAFAGAGEVIDMNERIESDSVFSMSNPYGLSFFDVPFGLTVATLLLFVAVFVTATVALLARRG